MILVIKQHVSITVIDNEIMSIYFYRYIYGSLCYNNSEGNKWQIMWKAIKKWNAVQTQELRKKKYSLDTKKRFI